MGCCGSKAKGGQGAEAPAKAAPAAAGKPDVAPAAAAPAPADVPKDDPQSAARDADGGGDAGGGGGDAGNAESATATTAAAAGGAVAVDATPAPKPSPIPPEFIYTADVKVKHADGEYTVELVESQHWTIRNLKKNIAVGVPDVVQPLIVLSRTDADGNATEVLDDDDATLAALRVRKGEVLAMTMRAVAPRYSAQNRRRSVADESAFEHSKSQKPEYTGRDRTRRPKWQGTLPLRSIFGTTIPIYGMSSEDTVTELKNEITYMIPGLATEQMRLVCEGEVLADDEKLGDQFIDVDTMVVLLFFNTSRLAADRGDSPAPSPHGAKSMRGNKVLPLTEVQLARARARAASTSGGYGISPRPAASPGRIEGVNAQDVESNSDE